MRMKKVDCPSCGAEIEIEDEVVQNEIVECEECGAQLVVKKVNNERIELEEIGGMEEDWGE